MIVGFLPLGLALALGELAHAIRFPVVGRRSLDKRGNAYGVSTLNNSQDFQYYTTINLGGQDFTQVLIDTGSSDLWIAGTVPNAKDTGATSGVQYAVGQVQGPIQTADLVFANHSVQAQAFLLITPDSTNPNGTGLIGLGPNNGSNIFHALKDDSAGAAPVDRIFRSNTSTPNYITALLGRYDDPTDTFPGDITVSEVVPGYEDILNQPKLNCTQVPTAWSRGQHWQTLLDENGIEVNGKAISLPETGVNTTSNSKQLTVIFDTGFTIPQVPLSIADAIYSGIDGAKFQNVAGVGKIWTFDCDIEINVTFKFGGVSFPIHPLDTSLDANYTTATGKELCLGGFQPITTETAGLFDMILGMAFLRNAYMLINYGDFVDDANTTADPYIQLYPLTNDTAEAHSDFLKVRGKSSSGIKNMSWRRLLTYIGFAALAALAVGVVAWICCARRRRTRATVTSLPTFGAFALPGRGKGDGAYFPLGTPAPEAHGGAGGTGGYRPFVEPHPGHFPGGEADNYYNQHKQGQYESPWDQRR